jgi:hypothetical protein
VIVGVCVIVGVIDPVIVAALVIGNDIVDVTVVAAVVASVATHALELRPRIVVGIG